jgi:hypothetical protein
MAQSIFIPKTPDITPVVSPVTEVVTQATQGMGGMEILYWVL